MKQRFFLASAIVALATALPATASAASMAANIASVFQLSGKVFVFVTNIAWDGAPSTCTPGPEYMIDPNTAVGRSQLALVLMAKANNSRVYLVGDGTCVGGGPSGNIGESLIGIQLQ